MSDLQRGSSDEYISVNDYDELRHWSKKLNTTPDALIAAVDFVGTSAVAVRQHLQQQHLLRSGK